jgi:hypothetical protein
MNARNKAQRDDALLYDFESAGQVLAIGTTTVRQLAHAGQLGPVLHIGRRTLLTRRGLEAFVASEAATPSPCN